MRRTASEITSNAITEKISDPMADGFAIMVFMRDLNVPSNTIFEFGINPRRRGCFANV